MKKTLYFLLSGWMLFLSIAFAQDPNRAPSGGANNPLAPLKKRLDDHKTKKEIFKKILEKDFKRTSVKDEDKKDKIDQLVTNILKNYNTSIETVANDLKNVIPEDKKLISTINKDLTSCDNICSSIEKNIQDGVYWMMYFNMTSNSTLWNEGKDEVITNTNNKIDSTIEKISGTQKKFLFIIISICVGCFILVLVLLIVAIKLWDKKYGDRLTDLEKANQTMSQVNIPGKIKDLQDDLKKIVLDFKNNLSSNLNNEEKGIATQITATLKDLPLNDLQTTLTNLPDQIIKKMSSTNGNSGNPTKTTNNRAVWLSNNSTNSSLKGNGGGESLQLDDSSLEKLCGAIVEKINIKSDINKVKESLKTLDTSIITPARGKVETLNQNAGALSGTIKKLSDTIIGLDEKLKNVSGEVEKVEEGANTKRAELLGDIKKAEENLNNIKNIIMQTADDVKANSTDNAEKISQKMAEAANTVANALQSVKDIQTKAIASVDEINEKALASVEDNNTKAMASMDEINQKVLASVEEINQKAMASIQDVNKKTEQINQASATLNSQMEGCRSREERLTRGAEGFGERLAELEKHITSLNGVVVGLSQLSQSLPLAVKAAELQQKLETANGMVKVKEEEVRKQTTEIQQQKTTIQQKESVIQNKDAEIQQRNTTIQQKDAEIQKQAVTIQQKDAEIQKQAGTIHQKDADILRLQNDLNSLYPACLMKNSEYKAKFDELYSDAQNGIEEAKVCMHSLVVIGDILSNTLSKSLMGLLLHLLWDFSRCFMIAQGRKDKYQSGEALKGLATWLVFFEEIAGGAFTLVLPQKGEKFDYTWMTTDNSSIRSVSIVESWAVFEMGAPLPRWKANVK